MGNNLLFDLEKDVFHFRPNNRKRKGTFFYFVCWFIWKRYVHLSISMQYLLSKYSTIGKSEPKKIESLMNIGFHLFIKNSIALIHQWDFDSLFPSFFLNKLCLVAICVFNACLYYSIICCIVNQITMDKVS